MLNETYLPVIGYEGLYEVSSLGNVRRVNKRNLKLGIYRYVQVSLCKDGVPETFSVHRLVATAFLENPQNFPDVNHKDGCKTNNNISNLEWCSRSYNIQHSFDNKLQILDPITNPNISKKLSYLDVCEIRSHFERGFKQKQISEIFKVDPSTISRIINNKYWKE